MTTDDQVYALLYDGQQGKILSFTLKRDSFTFEKVFYLPKDSKTILNSFCLDGSGRIFASDVLQDRIDGFGARPIR